MRNRTLSALQMELAHLLRKLKECQESGLSISAARPVQLQTAERIAHIVREAPPTELEDIACRLTGLVYHERSQKAKRKQRDTGA